ncbi:uncharacterized membrane-bound protein conserved in bacteria [Desulfitobacterium dehalogenans ATCC 51507]|uniref:Uncharacterized membrane-bound protein conserved in bacteria n=1 Tax=Desulfitobacterium dehalogenans (strain ATCC 51507 / DSM 9161 / JW/IU-DC1) TaxID=756499 RepID=I4A7U2_DESDJ|nr:hypothetical protein [Desulfitobacterium dehalogenans]AFM00027.1 uncharacterized membrane-bound protein conserved in bacteria [Desulfitobacterium dehalogenans ATCC 51507]
MKKATKESLKKNNLREKEIFKENQEVYTNMIVYIRSSNMTEYNQEVVREDIINMILDGQQRGDTIQKIMGGNYKEVCDEIIAAMPRKTPKERIMDFVAIILSALWVLGVIALVENLITDLLAETKSFRFILTVGDSINAAIIVLAAIAIYYYVSKTAFKTMKEKRVISFLKLWLVSFVVIGLLVLCKVYFTTAVLEIPLTLAAILVLAIFLIKRIVDR